MYIVNIYHLHFIHYFPCYIHRSTTLVLCDSRGVPVERHLSDVNVICKSMRGARLQDMKNLAVSMIPIHEPTTCLILAGINNMTIRNRHTRKVTLLYFDPFDLANHIIRLINRVRSNLIARFPNVKFAIGGIIGINLNRYNGIDGYSTHQWVMDEAIYQINAYIRLLNQQAGLYHPRLTTKVHTYYRGKPKNQYRLLSDGLHLGEILIASWAKNIERFHLVNTVGLPPFWAPSSGTHTMYSSHESSTCNLAAVNLS